MLDYLRHSYKILYKRNAYPVHLTYSVTSKCNARCKHCFRWDNLNNKKDELSLEEVKKISNSMPNFLYLLISGGEPFLKEELVDIVETFSKNNSVTNVVIPTNGSMPDKILQTTKEILERTNVNLVIYISIDGLNLVHDRIRGIGGLFKKAIETYTLLQDLKKDYKNLNVGFIMTMFSENQTKLKETYNYLRGLNPDSIFLNIARGNTRIGIKEIDLNNYKELNETIKKDLLTNRFKGFSNFSFSNLSKLANIKTHDIITRTIELNRFQIPCYAGTLNVVMDEVGNLYPCELINKRIGNLREENYNFKKIWNSESAKKIRQEIKDSKCFCTHECFINTNVLFNPKYIPFFIKNIILKKVDKIGRIN